MTQIKAILFNVIDHAKSFRPLIIRNVSSELAKINKCFSVFLVHKHLPLLSQTYIPAMIQQSRNTITLSYIEIKFLKVTTMT